MDNGFVSTIHIKNALVEAPLEITPALFLSDGTEYDLPPIRIPAMGVANVSVNDALANAPAQFAGRIFDYGNAALRYQFTGPGHLFATMEITNLPRSMTLTYPFSGVDKEMSETQTLEGVWWRHDPDVGGFVALTNVTGEPLSVSMQVFGSHGTALEPLQVAAPPHWTQLLDLDSLVGGLGGLENQAGGIRLQYTGGMGAILFSGGLLNEREGYSATMPFFAHDLSSDPQAITYASVGMMIGQQDPMMGFPPAAWFTPHVTLRNTTSHPLAVTGTFNYMAGGKPTSLALPVPPLNPFETRRLDFPDLLETLGLNELSGEANLLFSFTGRAGDLVLWTGSVDQTANFVFVVEPQGVGRSFGKASGYWTVANGFDTMYTVFNPTDHAQDIVATFHHGDGSGKYELPVQLEPQASKTLDLMDLIEAQRPDALGKVIPMTLPNGGVVFESAEGRAKWMTLVVSAGVYNAHRATCGAVCINCYGYSNFAVVVAPFSVAISGTKSLQSKATYSDGSVDTFTGSSSWSSNSTPIMTVNNSTYKGRVSGVSPGSASITAQFQPIVVYTGTVCSGFNPICPQGTPAPSGGGSTIPTVSIVGGNNFAFVSTDSSVKQYNLEQAQGTPSGGTYSWSASNSRVSFNNPSAALVTLTGNSSSTGLLDTTLTVNYTYNQKSATPATRPITVRIFKFLQQAGSTQVVPVNGPPNWGYNAYAYYNIKTNPSGQLVAPGFSNMTTFETVTIVSKIPSNIDVTLVSGSGATNTNSQILDDLSLLSPDGPLPSNLDIQINQDLAVEGIYVRNNTTHYYPSGPVITNNGPFN